MRKVLRRVREDQGPDAVILSNRRTDEGIEVIAAIDYDESILLQTLGSQPGPSAYRGIAEPAQDLVAELDADEPEAEEDAEAETDAEAVALLAADLQRVASNDRLSGGDQDEHETLDSLSESCFARLGGSRSGDESLDFMRTELSSIRSLMESQLSELVWKDEAKRSPIRAQILRNLARIGISPDVAAIVVSRLRSMPETNQVWRAPLAELVDLLPVKEDQLLSKGGIVAMIGPTGVGKTTSIAKIAARYALLHGTDDIALVCADAYRIGAKEHLAAFGRIIGAQVHSVGESGDLGDLLKGLQSKKLILIDTDGVSQRDTNLPNRLADYRRYSDRIDFYLTLSATSQESGLDETIRRFGELPLAGAVISKIDEAGQLGCVMNALIRHELPAIWFSDGQRIPDDIHEAARKRLWLVNQAISCMDASTPRIDERMMAERYAQASAAHA
jgi:flagellar biosynthesis protein FlhF